jgi:hypothetical protein
MRAVELARAPEPDVTLALAEHGPLLRQERWGVPHRTPLVFLSSFVGGWALNLIEPDPLRIMGGLDLAVLGFGAAALTAVSVTELHRTRHQRAFARRPARQSLTDARLGERVLLRGIIGPGPTTRSAGTKRDGVLALYLGRVASITSSVAPGLTRALQELRGLPFRLMLADGVHVSVDVSNAVFVSSHPLVEEPRFDGRPLFSHIEEREGSNAVCFCYAEDVLGPGDEVEVLGTYCEEPDPVGYLQGYRGARLAPRLTGSGLRPLLVRRVPGEPR